MRGAYYNEIDPFAAAWLRELIKAGHIADGEVDTRSIEDVRPDELRGFVQCHFFAGVGGWSLALRFAGWPDDRAVWTGSCPCQPFSAAGKGDGFADERHLWPAWHWLIEERRPVVVFGEQVESPAGRAWFDLVSTDLEATGYACGPSDLPVAGVGAPGIRQRLFWVADASSDTRHGSNLNDFVLLAGWPTSRAEDSESTGAHRGNPDTLTSAARLSGWHTPVVRDLRNSAGDGSNPRDLPRQVPLAAHGPTLTGSSARTGKRGQLNPAHSRWLQGYPREWDDCAATAMPSTRTSPRPSSRRIKKPEGNDVDGGHLKPSRVGQPGND
jgi:DNA (cytosine-5)-methyltransferase 1